MTIPAGYVCNQWGWFWKTSDNSGPYFLDRNGQMMQGFPSYLMTDNNGEFARLRVDVGQTSFWSGKQWRTFKKMTIPSLGVQVIRATIGVNIVLFDTSVQADGASIEMELVAGGTAAGPWTSVPVIRKNTMTTTPVLTPNVTIDHDGVHTGGTILDLIRVPAGNKSSNVSGTASERGVGPGTYYYRFTNVGNQEATVIFSGYWEERV